jgi:CarD-like/TRCF domain.
MFEIGNYIIHGTTGVCQVVAVGHIAIGSMDKHRLYYTLQPIYEKRSMVYTPVESDKVVMRKVLTKEEAQNLIESIATIELKWEEDNKVRDVIYKEYMKNQKASEWMEMIKILQLRKEQLQEQGKKITGVDEKYLHVAKEWLFGELAISLGMEKEEIKELVMSKIALQACN